MLRGGDVGAAAMRPRSALFPGLPGFPRKTRTLPERLVRRMYGLLTIETSGCIAFSLRVQSIWIDQALVIDVKPLTLKPLIRVPAPTASTGTQQANGSGAHLISC